MASTGETVKRRVARWYLGGGTVARRTLLRAIAGDVGVIALAVVFALPWLNLTQGAPRSALLTIAIVIGRTAAVLIRRRLPATALLAAAASGDLATLVCGYSAGYRIRAIPRTLLLVAAALVVIIARTLLEQGWTLIGPGSGIITWALVTVLPVLTGRYIAQRRAFVQTLRERADQLERERMIVVQQTRLRERTRIARDMHDSLGHQLTLIALHTGGLEVSGGLDAQQRETARLLRETAAAAMEELREIIGVLRQEDEAAAVVSPHALADPHRLAGMDALVNSARAAGQQVQLERTGEPRPLSLLAEQAAYRVVQEGLTNACKYAPEAPVTVVLRHESDAAVTEVVNLPAPDGPPVNPLPGGGQGLVGLRERARLAGGVLHAGPTPEGGFRLALVVPYEGPGYEGTRTVPAPYEGDRRQGGRGGANAAAVVDPDVGPWYAAPASESVPGHGLVLVVGMVVTVIVVIMVGGGLFTYFALQQLTADGVSPQTYDSIHIGQAEDEVMRLLPGKESALAQVDEAEHPKPAASTCRHYLSEGANDPDGSTSWYSYRFCFVNGKLVEKSKS